MKLTALEIKQQEFEKSFRGYDSTEVKAFLSIVASEWEMMVSRNKTLEQEIKHLKDKLSHYEKIQEGMHETLQIAKQSAEKEVSTATAEAKNRIEKAEMEAEHIINQARNERQQIRQSINRMLERREEIVNGIRSYLELANDSLSKFARDGETLYREEPEEADNAKQDARQAQRKKVASGALKDSLQSVAKTKNVDDIIDQID